MRLPLNGNPVPDIETSLPEPLPSPPPIICFSHLRWNFVTQRPQHLMRRFAREQQVFVFEEPVSGAHAHAYLEYHPFPDDDVIVLRPCLPDDWDDIAREAALRELLDMHLAVAGGGRPILWFYTPMMFGFARHIEAAAVVYDCMDELSGFLYAPAELRQLEADLLHGADVVFTGGYSLFEAKKACHGNIHPFPSSVELGHFQRARTGDLPMPADQAGIPHPRFGFYGVLDERIDLDLIRHVAATRPAWQFVMIGPIAKIAWTDLPQAPNIHYLGPKDYEDLPAYLAGWDVALMPFAINGATRFISPTKTPEYLAAGRPVVSTPITDVIRHYGGLDGVAIGDGPAAFIQGCEAMLALGQMPERWRPGADAVLASSSWDDTYKRMRKLIDAAICGSEQPVDRAPAPGTPLPAEL